MLKNVRRKVMASYIDLDSERRDREIYPIPSNYETTVQQVKSWFRHPRSTRGSGSNPLRQHRDFATVIELIRLTLPYDLNGNGGLGDFAVDYPRVYVNFYSRRYRDSRLVQTIGGCLPDLKFICELDTVQNDNTGAEAWVHYKCHDMEQTMRFLREDPVVIQITDKNGTPLPIVDNLVPADADPLRQTFVTFRFLPYQTDGENYANHYSSVKTL